VRIPKEGLFGIDDNISLFYPSLSQIPGPHSSWM